MNSDPPTAFEQALVELDRLRREREETRRFEASSQRRIADFAMAFELLRKLSGVQTEAEAIERITGLFGALFAPRELRYVPLPTGPSRAPHPPNMPDDERERLAALVDDFAWTADGDGFLLRIGRRSTTVGVVEVAHIAFPQHRDHSLELALSVADLCAMAITSARHEEEKQRLQEQLRHAAKMEAVGRLAGGVAHDFNNLLTAVRGYAELLMLNHDPGSDDFADLTEIVAAAERGGRLTQQLLAFTRKQVVNPEVVDLSELVRSAERLLRRLIGEEYKLQIERAATQLFVRVDPSQFDQVLINLVVNARDAMPRGGTIGISLAEVHGDESATPGHPGLELGDYVCVSVSDTGGGMDEETLRHVFEPFFSAKATGTGTGLGLATVYGIVKQNRGVVRVNSELGKGSRFDLYFPQVAAPAPQVSKSRRKTPPSGTETILLVEDDRALFHLVRRALRYRGYRVLGAADGVEGEAIAQSCPDEIHLLLTDVVMPRMNGKALYDRLLVVRPAMKALFMSGYAEDFIVRQGMVMGNLVLIQKPFELAGLLRVIRTALDGGTAQVDVSDAVARQQHPS